MKILMVCLGNICRSPLAEGILRQKAAMAGFQCTLDSAGTNGFHTGEAPHHLSQKVARLHQVDISSQRARNFTKEDLENFDVIYAMAGDVIKDIQQIAGSSKHLNKVNLFLDELKPGMYQDVPDPWYGNEDGYHEVFDLISNTCDQIINKYNIHQTQAIQ
ncbi:MAG: low molecular weight protein-tyrosine-phosphatase [Ferruginibacter sp.]